MASILNLMAAIFIQKHLRYFRILNIKKKEKNENRLTLALIRTAAGGRSLENFSILELIINKKHKINFIFIFSIEFFCLA